ncbi:Asx homology domain-containing protein [Cladochytrium replicatum]|nr:Asx homology domain-containing protein [Cladochytrium replicatum]
MMTSPTGISSTDGEWATELLLTQRTSALCDIELGDIIDYPTFSTFDPETQHSLALLVCPLDTVQNPDHPHLKSIAQSFFSYNPNLTESFEIFQNNLKEGLLEKETIDTMVKKQEDDRKTFDLWKEANFEAVWGDQIILTGEHVAGLSTHISLTELAMLREIMPGDFITYTRFFIANKAQVQLTGRIKSIGLKGGIDVVIDRTVNPDGSGSKRGGSKRTKQQRRRAPKRARGGRRGRRTRGGDDDDDEDDDELDEESEVENDDVEESGESRLFKNVINLGELETAFLDYDGRVKKGERPNGNAWKSFTLKRGKDFLGRLFDVRQHLYFKRNKTYIERND